MISDFILYIQKNLNETYQLILLLVIVIITIILYIIDKKNEN